MDDLEKQNADDSANQTPPSDPIEVPKSAPSPAYLSHTPAEIMRRELIKNLPAFMVVAFALIVINVLQVIPWSGEGYARKPPPAISKPLDAEGDASKNLENAKQRFANASWTSKLFIKVLELGILLGGAGLLILTMGWIFSTPFRKRLQLGKVNLDPGPNTQFSDVIVAVILEFILGISFSLLVVQMTPVHWWYWIPNLTRWVPSGRHAQMANLASANLTHIIAIATLVFIIRFRSKYLDANLVEAGAREGRDRAQDRDMGTRGLWPFWSNTNRTPARNVKGDLLLGVLFYFLFFLPLRYSIEFNMIVMEWLERKPDANKLVSTIANESNGMVLFGLGIVVVFGAAIFEEFLFRGVLYTSLKRYLGAWGGAIVAALGFSLVHGVESNILPLFLLALLLTWLYERTGRLVAPMALHATNNAVMFLVTTIQ